MNTLVCRSELRREAVRQQVRLCGLDYLEVGEDRRTLTVYFLGKVPESLSVKNVIVEDGRRIRDIKVQEVRITRNRMAELDDFMEVVTDKEGDFSTYTLRVVEREQASGRWVPHHAFDARYDRVEFNFKVDCPSDLDCLQEPACPPEPLDEPAINYLAKDYASFRQLLFDRLALVMPEWRERHVPDLGVTLVELLAYVGDQLSYYQDAVATEAYLDTARQRVSVRRHVRLVDYPMHEGCNARTWVCVEAQEGIEETLKVGDFYFITKLERLPVILKEDDLHRQTASYEVFEPMSKGEVTLYGGQHRIAFYTWGDEECCLRKGSNSATLVGRWIEPKANGQKPPHDCDPVLDVTEEQPPQRVETSKDRKLHLQVGDVLLFEEVLGPKTGKETDADLKHRHAVRLTQVSDGKDPLHPGLALTEITWAEEDALPFALCLSAMGPAPECQVIPDISVARGNLILVDHGAMVKEDLDPVQAKETLEECDCLGEPADVVALADTFNPRLKRLPQTWRQPLADNAPASAMLLQNPRLALPAISLTGRGADGRDLEWTPQSDLLQSKSSDRHFVVESENDGRSRLRFGNNELGQMPDAGTVFKAKYRVGNGPSGNVGAEAIGHLVLRSSFLSGAVINVRNPLAAIGGTAPEPLAEVKLYAPHAFRQRLERAITPKDYADIVKREFPNKVQRAAARLVWNGSWFEMLVLIDPLGQEEANPQLLKEIKARLYRYRRIGHDLVVKAAKRVSLDIEILVCVLPSYLRGHVKAALLEVFSNRRLVDGKLGFFHPDNLTFGDGVYLSQLVAAAQAVPGVESVMVTKLQRLFEAPNGEIESGKLSLGAQEIARSENDPSFPEHGRVVLDVRGGR